MNVTLRVDPRRQGTVKVEATALKPFMRTPEGFRVASIDVDHESDTVSVEFVGADYSFTQRYATSDSVSILD